MQARENLNFPREIWMTCWRSKVTKLAKPEDKGQYMGALSS